MSASKTSRGMTRLEEDSDDKQLHSTADTRGAPKKPEYLARVSKYTASQQNAQFPTEPLYLVGEVVYIKIGEQQQQQQPLGPFVVVFSNTDGTYLLKRQDNNEQHPNSVPEASLCVWRV